jgi:hypothetical protein
MLGLGECRDRRHEKKNREKKMAHEGTPDKPMSVAGAGTRIYVLAHTEIPRRRILTLRKFTGSDSRGSNAPWQKEYETHASRLLSHGNLLFIKASKYAAELQHPSLRPH